MASGNPMRRPSVGPPFGGAPLSFPSATGGYAAAAAPPPGYCLSSYGLNFPLTDACSQFAILRFIILSGNYLSGADYLPRRVFRSAEREGS